MFTELQIAFNDELLIQDIVTLPYDELRNNLYHPCKLIVTFGYAFFAIPTVELSVIRHLIIKALDRLQTRGKLSGVLIQVPAIIVPSRMTIRRIIRLVKLLSGVPTPLILELGSHKWARQTRFVSKLYQHYPKVTIATSYLENHIIEGGWALNHPSARTPHQEFPINPKNRIQYIIFWGTLGPGFGSYETFFKEGFVTWLSRHAQIHQISAITLEFRNVLGTMDLPLPLTEIPGVRIMIPRIIEEDPDRVYSDSEDGNLFASGAGISDESISEASASHSASQSTATSTMSIINRVLTGMDQIRTLRVEYVPMWLRTDPETKEIDQTNVGVHDALIFINLWKKARRLDSKNSVSVSPEVENLKQRSRSAS